MKKFMTLLFLSCLFIACSEDKLIEQQGDNGVEAAFDLSISDNSNLGLYRGIFSTMNSSDRGTIDLMIKEGTSSRAFLTLSDGTGLKFSTSEVIVLETKVINALFVADGASFKFSVNRDGSNPIFSEVTFGGEDAALKGAKETSRLAVTAQSGTWICTVGCGGSPSSTWSVLFVTGDGTGNYAADVTTMILAAGVDIGTTTGNTQDTCIDGGEVSSCDIAGATLGGAFTWTGTHSYTSLAANCSEASGVWTDGASRSGTFTSDVTCFTQGNFSFDPIPFTPNAEGTGCATEDNTFVASNWTDTGNPGSCGSGAADVWYSFTANATGLTIFTTFGSTLTTPFWTIYDDTLIEVDCNVGNSFGAIAITGLVVGRDYFLQISGGVDVGYCIEDFAVPTGPPANDLCVDAIAIGCDETVTGNTSAATDSDVSRGRDVWYSFDGTSEPVGTIITVSLCASGYDTWLGVYDDCAFTSLIASNDDNNAVCGSFGPSYLEFTNDGATNYIIRVDGFNAASFGAYELTIGCIPPPPPPSCDPADGTGLTGPITDGACPVDDAFTQVEPTVGFIGTTHEIDALALNITHTWVADLEIKLVAPDGLTSLDLSIGNGGSGDNYTATSFEDGGGDITLVSAPFTGPFAPQGGTFATAFAGQPVDGVWTLAICDNTGGDAGTLVSWNLCFNTITAPTAAPSEFEISNLNVSDSEAAEKRAINAQTKNAMLEKRRQKGKQ